MKTASETLARFGVPHECRVLSAHRTPGARPSTWARPSREGIEVVIAAAGGAAHLAGVVAAHTLLPVLGVPMESASLQGLDSLLSTVQMPAGIPVPAPSPSASRGPRTRRSSRWPSSRTSARSCAEARAFREEQTAKVLKETLT